MENAILRCRFRSFEWHRAENPLWIFFRVTPPGTSKLPQLQIVTFLAVLSEPRLVPIFRVSCSCRLPLACSQRCLALRICSGCRPQLCRAVCPPNTNKPRSDPSFGIFFLKFQLLTLIYSRYLYYFTSLSVWGCKIPLCTFTLTFITFFLAKFCTNSQAPIVVIVSAH